MSIKIYQYCGPFLKCKVIRRSTRLLGDFKVCSTPHCKANGKRVSVSYRFCPECSGKLENSYVEVMERAFSWYDEIGDRELFQAPIFDDFDFLIPNNKNTPTRNRIPENSDEQPISIVSAEDVIEDKRKFSQHYAEIIKKAKELYGSDGVEVEWGIVSYYM